MFLHQIDFDASFNPQNRDKRNKKRRDTLEQFFFFLLCFMYENLSIDVPILTI